MGVNSLPKTVTQQRRDCDLNPGPTAPESSTHFLHLSLSSVILTDSSMGSPVHVLMLSVRAVRGLPRLRAPGRPTVKAP